MGMVVAAPTNDPLFEKKDWPSVNNSGKIMTVA
jgi:hypothetical protein